MNAEIDLLWCEAGEHPAHELGREDLGQDGAGDQHGGHHGDDDGESLLRILLALFREETGVDRDKSDRSGASRDDVVEPVGQSKRGDVSVGLLAGSESIGNVGFADVSDGARERDGRHQKQRGRKGGVLM